MWLVESHFENPGYGLEENIGRLINLSTSKMTAYKQKTLFWASSLAITQRNEEETYSSFLILSRINVFASMNRNRIKWKMFKITIYKVV